jgi:hypothetical protein
MLETVETIKKHGALGMTVIALIWMNARLSSVEEKLYNCLSNRQEINQASTHRGNIFIKTNLIAILPNERKNSIKRTFC